VTVEIRTATATDIPPMWATSRRAFGKRPPKPEALERIAAALDIDRWLVAVDGEQVVGTAGSIGFDITLPGPITVPMLGVCTATVAASHRRQGILSNLLGRLDQAAAANGEPVLALYASEGPIYERFGYGSTTQIRVVEVDARATAIHPRWDPEPVELAVGDDEMDRILDIWDRYRVQRVGAISRPPSFAQIELFDPDAPVYAAFHPDGFALYEIEQNWGDGAPGHQVLVTAFCAITPEAHLALWNLLLSIDLVSTVRAVRVLSIDDPLPSLLTDPRAVRTVALNDGLWVKVGDPVAAFGRRFDGGGYRGLDTLEQPLSVAVVDSVDALEGSDEPVDGFTLGIEGCTAWETPNRADADLVAARSGLGPLLFGDAPSTLAANRRLVGSPATLERADLVFATTTVPFSTTAF
jgi:predicted acetyltransferase